jgi:spore germination cell wall hydrolase CwlJ-like protein
LALVAEDTKSLSLLTQTRGEPRALTIAALSGIGLGLAVGSAFMAGRMAADATHQTQGQRVATAVRQGMSDAALQHIAVPSVPVSAKPTALRAAVLQVSTPFRLAGPVEASRDLDCLTAAVYYEARGETSAGQAAVAQVVLNRVRHPAFPKSVCAVVYQGAATHSCQFSFACNGAMRAGHELGAWDRARDVAARALSGYVMNDVGRATHFHVASLGGIWGAGMVRVAQIGSHVFYTFGAHRTGLSSAEVAASSDASDIALPSAAAPAPPSDKLASADTPPVLAAAKPASAAATAASATVKVSTAPSAPSTPS